MMLQGILGPKQKHLDLEVASPGQPSWAFAGLRPLPCLYPPAGQTLNLFAPSGVGWGGVGWGRLFKLPYVIGGSGELI